MNYHNIWFILIHYIYDYNTIHITRVCIFTWCSIVSAAKIMKVWWYTQWLQIGTGSYCILPIVVCICNMQGIYSHFVATKNNAEHDVLKHGWLQPRMIRYCIWMWAPGIGLCRRRMLPRCWRWLVLAYVTPHGLCVDTRLQQLEIIRLAKHHATQVRKQKDIMAT